MEKVNKFKNKVKDFFKKNNNCKCVNFLKTSYNNLKKRIFNSYEKCKIGEENLNTILIYWALLPMFVYFFTRNRLIKTGIFCFILDFFCFLLFCLALYFIIKAVDLHPEYDKSRIEELKKIEYYNSLSEEEFKKVKKEENKFSTTSFFKRFILLRSDKSTEPFKLVKILLIMFILLCLKRIIF